MKSELKENMYVRTKDGKIGKLMGYMASNENKIAIWTNTTEEGIKITPVIDKDAIIKVSYNIIDILEEGDYVNGYLVTDVYKPDGNEVFRIEIERDTLKGHIIDKLSQIKSIVTKEQMEQMAYKVGE